VEDKAKEVMSPRVARAWLEEQLEKLDIIDEEATPLVIDGHDEGAKQKWPVVGKVLYRHVFHINTISTTL
jgi:hypothetical protein